MLDDWPLQPSLNAAVSRAFWRSSDALTRSMRKHAKSSASHPHDSASRWNRRFRSRMIKLETRPSRSFVEPETLNNSRHCLMNWIRQTRRLLKRLKSQSSNWQLN
jgi:hypothetical protein